MSHRSTPVSLPQPAIQRSRTAAFGNISYRDAIRRLVEISKYEENWDSYGGRRLGSRAMTVGVAFLELIAERPLPEIAVVPTSSGGVQFEWSSVEVEIARDGILHLFRLQHDGVELELSLAPTDPLWRWRASRFLSY